MRDGSGEDLRASVEANATRLPVRSPFSFFPAPTALKLAATLATLATTTRWYSERDMTAMRLGGKSLGRTRRCFANHSRSNDVCLWMRHLSALFGLSGSNLKNEGSAFLRRLTFFFDAWKGKIRSWSSVRAGLRFAVRSTVPRSINRRRLAGATGYTRWHRHQYCCADAVNNDRQCLSL